jgi:hypothetical protein
LRTNEPGLERGKPRLEILPQLRDLLTQRLHIGGLRRRCASAGQHHHKDQSPTDESKPHKSSSHQLQSGRQQMKTDRRDAPQLSKTPGVAFP